MRVRHRPRRAGPSATAATVCVRAAADLRLPALPFLVVLPESAQSLVVEPRVGERHQEQLEDAEELVGRHRVRLLAEQLQRLLALSAPHRRDAIVDSRLCPRDTPSHCIN